MPTIHLSDEAYNRYKVLADDAGVSVTDWLENSATTETITIPSFIFKAVNALPAMMYIFDFELGYNTYINTYTANFFGMSLSEMQQHGQQFLIDVLHPDDRHILEDYSAHWETATDSDVFTSEYRFRRHDGEYRWLRTREIVLRRDPDGTVTATVGYTTDITEMKQKSEALRESEARYRTLAEHFPHGLLALYDHDLRYTVMNGKGLEQLGLTAEDLNKKRLRDFMPPEVYERDQPLLKAALEGHTQEAIRSYDGYYFQIVTAPVQDADGQVIGGMLLSQNITSIKQSEQQQRLRNQQLELAIETAKIGIWERDIHTDVLSWSDRQLEIYGYTREAFDSQSVNWWDTIHPDDRAIVEDRLTTIREEGELLDIQFRIYRHNDFALRYITASGRSLYDAQGNLIKVIGINIDVTDIIHSQEELAASEARYRALIQGAMNPIAIYDEDGNVVFLNDAARALVPSELDIIIGEPLPHLSPEDLEILRKNSQYILQNNETMEFESKTEIGGKTYWFWSVLQPLIIEGRDVQEVQVITYDITERKTTQELQSERLHLEQELQKEQELATQRQKILSILSHEIRTPLSIISTSSDILTRYHDKLDAEKRKKRFDNIKTQIRYLEQMLDEISHLAQSFDGILKYRPQRTDIIALCERIISEIEGMIDHKHEIILSMTSTRIDASIDTKLMYYAIVNLMTNAIKYTPNGGIIQFTIIEDANTVQLIVADDGIGIPDEDQKDLFKPFNRASNVGQIRGTGLGLSIVAEVVNLHAGTIDVVSAKGLGTTFTIQIPKT